MKRHLSALLAPLRAGRSAWTVLQGGMACETGTRL